MMKTLTLLLLFVTTSFFVSVAQGTWGDDDSKKPVLEWTSDSYDFGKIPQGTPVSHDFEFKNASMFPLLISNAKPSCQCTSAEYPKQPVKGGAKGIVKAKYTAENLGFFSKSVIIYSNAKDGEKELFIKGEVVAVE